jgi:uncharacterized protein
MARSGQALLVIIALWCGAQTPMAQPVPSPVSQVSADCAFPVYATDMLVCADPVLRGLDAEMLELWNQVAAVHKRWQAEQEAWFRRRSLCAFDPDHRACAMTAYRERIIALRAARDQP